VGDIKLRIDLLSRRKRRNSGNGFDKNLKNPFWKLWHFVPMFCRYHETGCKQASAIFLPTTEPIPMDGKAFKKKNIENFFSSPIESEFFSSSVS